MIKKQNGKFDSEENPVMLENMDLSFFLIGLLSEFENRFQAEADRIFKELSWKQCFVMNCAGLFDHPPTISELSDLVGSSHQNIKQILLKLEKQGYVTLTPDQKDRRKLRVNRTQKAEKFGNDFYQVSVEHMDQLFQGIEKEDLQITVNTIMKLDEHLRGGFVQ
ncbi:MAG: MarR family transcriptional regulator [Clostridia bacterium]|nr:MarR family transcriptional regulator [Clostridia bacterium]